MARPHLVGLGTKAQFRREVPKSYSYRYEVGSATGPDGAPSVRAVIETRYRGKSASWKLRQSMMSDDAWTLNGQYVAPSPENPLSYPPRVVKPTQEMVAAAEAAMLAQHAPPPPEPTVPRPVTPAPAPAPPRVERTTPRADPAESPGISSERIISFGRKFAGASRKVG